MSYPLKGRRVFVAGHRGLAGSAIVRRLQAVDGGVDVLTRTREELDLFDPKAVEAFFRATRPHVVIDAAARVGGIRANNEFRGEFLLENLIIQNNLGKSAHDFGVERFVFLGSSCIYPKMAPQPMKEEILLTGPLEYTNRPYAVAKIAGLELVNALNEQHGHRYFSVMPTNLYGPGDNFDALNSHVIPGLMRRFHEAKIQNAKAVTVWGTGKARREFLHIDDMADAVIHLAETLGEDFFKAVATSPERYYHVNVGSGEEVTIGELANAIARTVGYTGQVLFDVKKPDGSPRKLLDSSRLFATGWRPKVGLEEGLQLTYEWYVRHLASGSVRNAG